MIDLSIVIASYERADLLDACLGAVERARDTESELRIEVIVVDNGSTDESVARAKASPLGVRVIALDRNLGFAAAVNLGLRIRRGRHVLLLNSDALIEVDLLGRGVSLLDRMQDIGVLGAELLHPDGRPQRSVHAFPDWTSEVLPERLLRSLRRRQPRGSRGSRDGEASASEAAIAIDPAILDVDALRGAVFFIRGATLDEVGELDEGYFFFLEETDYCWRVHAAGQRVIHWTALRAIHLLGASSKARAPLATRIEYQRSLDRFIRIRRGPGAARLARVLRLLRGLVGFLPLALVAPLVPGLRPRFRERGGLLLWHLRGRPAEPVLAQVLAAAARAKEGISD